MKMRGRRFIYGWFLGALMAAAGMVCMPAQAAVERRGGSQWSMGDTIVREIGGESYVFRCVDENYSDRLEYHRPGALFLCESVIPADFGSKYVLDTSVQPHEYVFYPGPITKFGDRADYKYSAVRVWLEGAGAFADAEPVNTGVSTAFCGSTKDGGFGLSGTAGLSPTDIGSQRMTDRLFILSVEEAVKYKNWLWKFEGSSKNNPESQITGFCRGYWLRSPLGTDGEQDGSHMYIVDLEDGCIRPETIIPSGADKGAQGDTELLRTSAIGVRPVFVLRQP